MPNKDAAKADVLQGTLDLMVLHTLETLGPLHGYAIAARLEQTSGGALQLNMGTLYPALMRLEQRGLLRGDWGTSENNRKARFYSLTAAGRRQLAQEKREWSRMTAIVDGVLRGEAKVGRGDQIVARLIQPEALKQHKPWPWSAGIGTDVWAM